MEYDINVMLLYSIMSYNIIGRRKVRESYGQFP